jgi:endonuclease YncB( thermonuclease family)
MPFAPAVTVCLLAAASTLLACQPPAASAPAQTSERPDIQPAGPTQQAIVVDVTDGDTIAVEVDGARYSVRYVGVDAPEQSGPFTEAESLGAEAEQANALLVGGQTVHLERDVSDVDRFDRLLRYVWLDTPSGWTMVNREMVRLGLAEARDYEPDTRWQAILNAAEHAARTEGLGIWGVTPQGP